MNPEKGRTVIEILKSRGGKWTSVFLKNGQELSVFNIAWGYDLGDDYAHVTTNISPANDEPAEVDFFTVDEVTKIADAETGRVVWSLE